MNRIGLDVGTKNIVLAYRDGNKKIKFKREINGFLSIEKTDGFMGQMLKMQKVPVIERDDRFIALGQKAEEMAYAFGNFLRRPMEQGVLSVGEDEAMKIVSAIIKGIIGKLKDDTVLYYCVPAKAVNAEVNVQFHQKIVQAIVDSYRSDEFKLVGHPMNEARAIVLSQIPDKTGIAVSFGAGMVNVSYCMFGLPIYEFSIVGSGDWIDVETARVTGNLEEDEHGKSKAAQLVTKAKEEIDLSKGMPSDNLSRAIYINYGLLIDNVVKGIVEGFMKNESKARSGKPMPVICAGGTSSPNGFLEMFANAFQKEKMPFDVGEISRAPEPLYAVAEGCLIACELHEE